MPINLILSAILTAGVAIHVNSAQPAAQPEAPQEAADPMQERFTTARDLLVALANADADIETLQGEVRLTAIQALQGDLQTRRGKLSLRTVRPDANAGDQIATDRRLYAVNFDELRIDARVQAINEQYIFDGRWFVERHPEELQFIKREVVPAGQTLDPMDLMRDAPFWVSVGDDADVILEDYDAVLFDAQAGIAGDLELKGLAPFVQGTVQLKLSPKPNTAGADDWESVRMWFDQDTLLPRLYVKTEWTGDRQIAELFSVKTNTKIPARIFDTTTPELGSGWQVQVSPWRGRADG